MKKNLIITFFIFNAFNLFGQNFNVIIQVNDRNLNGEIANMYLSNNSKRNDERIAVNYYPGDLIIPEYEKLNF